ncbi:hypothetical protein CBM2609_B70233 [Cupriavidus taiwanensis]|nr:hypothetical protein CBM2609_B70233 [Cupriavidus taiwanensis]SOZ48604.1 hypothetical protein CBM2610_B50233 [Cupriavidus taiwanensis]
MHFRTVYLRTTAQQRLCLRTLVARSRRDD